MAKTTKKAKPGEVWKILEGPGLEHLGYLVTETGNPHRQIAAFVLVGPDDAENELRIGLRHCREIAADPDRATRSQTVHDLRQLGNIDSTERVWRENYHPHVLREGKDWVHDKEHQHSFPFCRFRIAEMILSLPPETPAIDILMSIVNAMPYVNTRPDGIKLVAAFQMLIHDLQTK